MTRLAFAVALLMFGLGAAIENAGDSFKLRWRDYGTLPPIIRPRFEQTAS
jgi:hypothetical protein